MGMASLGCFTLVSNSWLLAVATTANITGPHYFSFSGRLAWTFCMAMSSLREGVKAHKSSWFLGSELAHFLFCSILLENKGEKVSPYLRDEKNRLLLVRGAAKRNGYRIKNIAVIIAMDLPHFQNRHCLHSFLMFWKWEGIQKHAFF